ncbi:ATP-dependent zinc protease family protein [Eisenibacter elegans]|jgi:hypothetical protein|uniref:ATP-dependent zinc protease family protein n=1 Tax=Eisenibacter elegans TaxID=997 RepID=UPI0003FDD035|nr:ATP-dependent zinc protease [Eisenibacter elegans]
MTKKKNTAPKRIIGTRDRIDFVDFALFDLPCKIDTGAETSAIHCHHVKLIEKEGQELISFKLLDPSHPEYDGVEYRTAKFEERRIRSSFGHTEYRYVITTQVQLFGEVFSTQFTLADRVQMKFPVLLGKRLLKNQFLVDVSLVDLSFKQKQQNLSTQTPL